MATQSARQPDPDPDLDADATVDVESDREPASEPGPEPAPEPEIDPELLARRREALRYVRKLGDPVLRARAIEVDRFDDRLREQIERMGVLMDDAMGVGLAATQLGLLQRLLVYRVQQESPVIALVNPELEWSGDEQEVMEEGCLSLPGVHVDVERSIRVRVRARDEYGEPVLVEASGLEARVIAHEMDHLDGVLILDRTTREQRREAMRLMREAAAAAAAGDGP
ncbi:MAG TPA: peptide deformylase [Solirubrobacteraceae bacterium]|nr:peptide deformylase [Solirubrobacteraceae bacterium]